MYKIKKPWNYQELEYSFGYSNKKSIQQVKKSDLCVRPPAVATSDKSRSGLRKWNVESGFIGI